MSAVLLRRQAEGRRAKTAVNGLTKLTELYVHGAKVAPAGLESRKGQCRNETSFRARNEYGHPQPAAFPESIGLSEAVSHTCLRLVPADILLVGCRVQSNAGR